MWDVGLQARKIGDRNVVSRTSSADQVLREIMRVEYKSNLNRYFFLALVSEGA